MSATCQLRTGYKNGTECGAPAAYRVYGADCQVCDRYSSLDECGGHPVCVDHAADLRARSVPQIHPDRADQPPPFVVIRLQSLDRPRVSTTEESA